MKTKFIPNEAVSTCYAVACDWSEANNYEDKLGVKGGSESVWDYGSNKLIGCVKHSESGCGTYSSQTLTVKNGILTNIKEGTLNGHLYENSNYIKEVKGLSINDGTKIYWTTTSGNRTWHHQGRIIEIVDHKTMS